MDALVQQASKNMLSQGIQGAPGMSIARELHTQDWKQARILEGRGFIATVGSFSTPVVGGGAGTVIDLDQPEFGMIIPANYAVVPLRIAAQLTTPLGATDADECEFGVIVDTAAATVAAALDGTWANTITPKNMRIALTNAVSAASTVKSVCSADTTDPTSYTDIFHTQYTYETKTDAGYSWTRHDALYEPVNPPYIVGPASLFMYWGGTVATSAFMQFFFLEIPTALLLP